MAVIDPAPVSEIDRGSNTCSTVAPGPQKPYHKPMRHYLQCPKCKHHFTIEPAAYKGHIPADCPKCPWYGTADFEAATLKIARTIRTEEGYLEERD